MRNYGNLIINSQYYYILCVKSYIVSMNYFQSS